MNRIYLELTTRCNYRCVYCPHPTMQRDKRHMDLALAFEALEQIASGRIGTDVWLNYLGEPLLYPEFFSVVERAHALGLRANVTTNGSLLTPRMVDKIKASALSTIKISHDSSEDDISEIHGAPKYSGSRILGFIENTLRALDQTDKRIFIILMTTKPGFARGIDGVEIICTPEQLRAETRVVLDTVKRTRSERVRPWTAIARDLENQSWEDGNLPLPLTSNVFLEVRPTQGWSVHYEEGQVKPALTGSCDALVQQVGILVNGDVVPCCVDAEGELVLGNILKQRLHTILRGAKACTIRNGFAENRVVMKKCQLCLGTPLPLQPRGVVGLPILS